jgi:hypothetical protein
MTTIPNEIDVMRAIGSGGRAASRQNVVFSIGIAACCAFVGTAAFTPRHSTQQTTGFLGAP